MKELSNLNILGLVELDCLQELTLDCGKPFDEDTTGYLASLMYHMVLLRPCVSCRVPSNAGPVDPVDQLSKFRALM